MSAIITEMTVELGKNELISLKTVMCIIAFRIYGDFRMRELTWITKALTPTLDRHITKFPVGAADTVKPGNKAVADTNDNRYYIPLDFEALTIRGLYYQSGLSDHHIYELTFKDYSRVVVAGDHSSRYHICGICLMYDIVRHKELDKLIRSQYIDCVAFQYDREHYFSRFIMKLCEPQLDTTINVPCLGLKDVLILFEGLDEPFQQNSEIFINPGIKIVKSTWRTKPVSFANKVCTPLICGVRYLVSSRPGTRHSLTGMIAKVLHLSDVNLESYFTNKFGLCLVLRITHDGSLHGSGRTVRKTSQGLSI